MIQVIDPGPIPGSIGSQNVNDNDLFVAYFCTGDWSQCHAL